MTTLKVGDYVKVINKHDHDSNWVRQGASYLISSLNSCYDDGDDGHEVYIESISGATDNLCLSQLELVTKSNTKKINRTGKEYIVFRRSCNNHEETIYAKNDDAAKKQFRKEYKNREGYYLTKILIESKENKEVVFQ